MRADVDTPLVQRLVASQFPEWSRLSLRPLLPGGWDHRSFRLGDAMLIRLPSAQVYAEQVQKERRWLAVLAPGLPLLIPTQLALGAPAEGYPWHWAIYRWIDAESAADRADIGGRSDLASSLGLFLQALQCLDCSEAPLPGAHNFHRGGPLDTYDEEARRAFHALRGKIDTGAAMKLWKEALATSWGRRPVWIHGDMSPGNLLIRDGQLVAVIDFGNVAAGDPACDLAIAWTLFTRESRSAFRAAVSLDEHTWRRGRAWALWKASIVAAGMTGTNAAEAAQCWRTLAAVLDGDG